MKARYWLVLVLLALSILPLIGLKVYIQLTGDFQARWLFVRFMYLQFAIWGGFVASAIYCAYQLILGRVASLGKGPSSNKKGV